MLTVADVAARLDLCKMTVYRLIHAGRLPAVKVGRSYRISSSAFDKYLRQVRTDGSARDKP